MPAEANTAFELKLDDQTKSLLRAATEDTWLKVKPFETVRKQQIEKALQFQAGKIREADQILKTEAARLIAMFDEKGVN